MSNRPIGIELAMISTSVIARAGITRAGISRGGATVGVARLRADQAPRVRLAVLIVAILLATLLAPRVSAQGTMGQFPDPISTPELTRLLERYLSLRPEQWPAIEVAHDEYRRQFQELRDGDIQRVLDASGAMQGTIPTKAVVEDLMRRTDRATNRIRGLDERLFDQIGLALDDGQVAALIRVRQARERARNLSSQATMWIGTTRPADLSQIALEMDLTPERRRAVDAVLVSYEPTLTRQTKAFHEAGNKMLIGLIEAMEAAGMANMTQEDFLADPERMTEIMEVMQQSWTSIAEEAQKVAREIRELNHRVRRQITDTLGDEAGREFRRRFIMAAYPTIAAALPRGEAVANAALRVDGLQPAQRDAIESLLRNYRMADDGLVDDQIALFDDQVDRMNPMEFDSADMAEHTTRERALAERRNVLADELRTNVEAIVGVDALANAERRRAEPERDEAEAVSALDALAARDAAEAAGGADAGGAPQSSATAGRAGVQGPIDVRQLGTLAGRLSLDPDRRRTLEALHSSYLAEWESTIVPLVEELHSAQRESSRARSTDFAAAAESVERTYAQRFATIEAIEAIDGRFISSAADAIAHDHERGVFEMFALARSVAVHIPVGMMSMSASANQEAFVNMPLVLTARAEDHDLLPIIEVAVLEHADALRRSTRAMLRAALDSESAMMKLGSEYASAGGDAAAMAEIATRSQARLAENAKRLEQATSARRAANHKVLDELQVLLPPDRFQALDRAYRHAAWPTIYGGPGSPLPLLERTLAMEDLDDAQRAAIEKIRADAEAAFDAVSERMAEASSMPSTMDFSSPEAMQRWTEQQQTAQRLRFERNEVASRAIRRARAVLTEQQAARLPGLATFDDTLKQSTNWWEQ